MTEGEANSTQPGFNSLLPAHPHGLRFQSLFCIKDVSVLNNYNRLKTYISVLVIHFS